MNKKIVSIAAFLNDYKLVISAGAIDGIEIGMELNVLSKKGQEIKNPLTSETLGKIPHIKAEIIVVDVKDKFSICVLKKQNLPLHILKIKNMQYNESHRFKFEGKAIERKITDEPLEIGDEVEI
ncbi:hypothetical protein ACEE08_11180 [Staphylococcus rostri]